MPPIKSVLPLEPGLSYVSLCLSLHYQKNFTHNWITNIAKYIERARALKQYKENKNAMETSILKTVGQVAGLGGLALGLLLLIFKEVIRKNVFSQLTKNHSYSLLRLIIILAFTASLAGIGAWLYSLTIKGNSTTEASIHNIQFNLLSPNAKIYSPSSDETDTESFGGKGSSLEISDIFYDKQKKIIDIKVRNNTSETTIINRIVLKFSYQKYSGGALSPSGTLDSTIPTNTLDYYKNNKKVLNFTKAFRVSYAIPPKGADRYLFKFNIDKSKLYFPPNIPGDYKILFNFYYNKDELESLSESLDDLEQGLNSNNIT